MSFETANNILAKEYESTTSSLDELVHFKRGKNITSSQMKPGLIPVVSAGLKYSGHHNISNVKGPSITISSSGANAGIVLFHDYDFWAADCLFASYSSNMLFSNYFLKYIQPVITNLQRGSAQPHVYAKNVNKLKVSLPNENVQNKIGLFFQNYDKLISINNKKIEMFKKIGSEFYKENFVRNRKHSLKIKKMSLEDMLNGHFNGGWGDDVANEKRNIETSVIRGTDINDILNSDFANIPKRFHSMNEAKNKQLVENDVILELSNGNINNIGRNLFIVKTILSNFKNVMCASFCKTLRFKSRQFAISFFFGLNYLQQSGLLNFYKNTGTNGINNFNFKRFLKHKFAVIPNELLDLYANLLEIENLHIQKNIFLVKERDSFLPKIMTGKINILNGDII